MDGRLHADVEQSLPVLLPEAGKQAQHRLACLFSALCGSLHAAQRTEQEQGDAVAHGSPDNLQSESTP